MRIQSKTTTNNLRDTSDSVARFFSRPY